MPEHVRALLYAAHERFAAVDEGENSDVYPALEAVPRDLFGIAVAATEGAIYAVGDAEYPFSIMSVSKPFVFALVCADVGAGFSASSASSRSSIATTTVATSSCLTIRASVLSPEQFPNLAAKVGDDIVTASGTTLLGADDKAGVAIIMAMARHLLQHPDLATDRSGSASRRTRRSAAASRHLPNDLQADVAYTLDGAELGEVVYETFSADKAIVTIQGVSAHPGQAKDVLVNALHLAAKIVDDAAPRHADAGDDERSPGLHPRLRDERHGGEAELHFILRDFERDGLQAHGELLQQVCDTVQATEPRAASPARSRRSTATCATGWKRTCARSSWRGRPAASSGSSRSPRRPAAAPMARA